MSCETLSLAENSLNWSDWDLIDEIIQSPTTTKYMSEEDKEQILRVKEGLINMVKKFSELMTESIVKSDNLLNLGVNLILKDNSSSMSPIFQDSSSQLPGIQYSTRSANVTLVMESNNCTSTIANSSQVLGSRSLIKGDTSALPGFQSFKNPLSYSGGACLTTNLDTKTIPNIDMQSVKNFQESIILSNPLAHNKYLTTPQNKMSITGQNYEKRVLEFRNKIGPNPLGRPRKRKKGRPTRLDELEKELTAQEFKHYHLNHFSRSLFSGIQHLRRGLREMGYADSTLDKMLIQYGIR